MFIWDFGALFAVSLILSIGLVLTLWIRYNFKREAQEVVGDSVGDYFRQCNYCSYVYLDYFKKNPCRCPRCLSYHD